MPYPNLEFCYLYYVSIVLGSSWYVLDLIMKNTTTHMETPQHILCFFRDFFLSRNVWCSCHSLLEMGICSSVECAGAKREVVNGICCLLDPFFAIIQACSLSPSLSFPVDIDGIDCLLACGVQRESCSIEWDFCFEANSCFLFFSCISLHVFFTQEGCQLHCDINLLLSDQSMTCPGPWVFLLINFGNC